MMMMMYYFKKLEPPRRGESSASNHVSRLTSEMFALQDDHDSDPSDSWHASSSDDESNPSSLNSSSDDQQQREEKHPPVLSGLTGMLASSMRRRNAVTPETDQQNLLSIDPEVGNQQRRKRKKTKTMILPTNTHRIVRQCGLGFCNRFSTIALTFSFAIWIFVMIIHDDDSRGTMYSDLSLTLRERTKARIAKRARRSKRHKPFLQTVTDGFLGAAEVIAISKAPKNIVSDTERLPEGCYRPSWQDMAFPNCNEIHSIDLTQNILPVYDDQHILRRGYISSGLWRDVWAVAPSEVSTRPAVIKILRGEHRVDDRNFDRHRRDALTMERLTSNSNIVDIYAFCGNTVLTEFIPTTLHDIVFNQITVGELTRQTEQGRLKLFLETTRSIKAIHGIPGGPIVHADLQAKQFLVRENGEIALNDFNRCRFMAHKNQTGQPCAFHIPTAPGKHRSPEEYEQYRLDEKIDVYSMGNIYLGILTGEDPWIEFSTEETIRYVTKGYIPLTHEMKNEKGTVDLALWNITKLAYEKDPRKRVSAAEILKELEKLRAKIEN